MLKYINIHTHSIDYDADVFSIKNIVLDEPFALENNQNYSVGLHPWYLEAEYKDQDLEEIVSFSNTPEIIAIGEIGLDRLTEIDFDLQMEMFERQLLLAENVKKPVIIHCVKAFSEIIAVKKRIRPRIDMIVHGYNQNEQILVQLIKHNFYISLGEAILNPISNAAMLLPLIPLDRLFLETDDYDVSIKDIYKKASQILKIEETELMAIFNDNFERVFNFRP
jgi:TatD DNase family protein